MTPFFPLKTTIYLWQETIVYKTFLWSQIEELDNLKSVVIHVHNCFDPVGKSHSSETDIENVIIHISFISSYCVYKVTIFSFCLLLQVQTE